MSDAATQAYPRLYRARVDGRTVYQGASVLEAHRTAAEELTRDDCHAAVIEENVRGSWRAKARIGPPNRPPGEIMLVLTKEDLSRLIAGKEATSNDRGRRVRIILEDIGVNAIRRLLEALPDDKTQAGGCCGGRCKQATQTVRPPVDENDLDSWSKNYRPTGKVGEPVIQSERVKEVWDPQAESYREVGEEEAGQEDRKKDGSSDQEEAGKKEGAGKTYPG